MKKLYICRLIFIINLCLFLLFTLLNIGIKKEIMLKEKEINTIEQNYNNNKKVEKINCGDVFSFLNKKQNVHIKSIENDKNNIYVKLDYLGDISTLNVFLEELTKTKNFKSIKELNINNNKEKNINITLEYLKSIN